MDSKAVAASMRKARSTIDICIPKNTSNNCLKEKQILIDVRNEKMLRNEDGAS
jgi:hypothetical protein